MSESQTAELNGRIKGSSGIFLGADVAGPADGPPVILVHGGGQTRQSWDKAVPVLAQAGYRVTNLDLRGHGESDWTDDYSLEAFSNDIEAVCRIQSRPPVIVGASLGGLSSLIVAGRSPALVGGLVLVDVTPQVEQVGANRIRDFMLTNADAGFASLDEAADAVAAYNPHRPRPKSSEGLKKNLRLRDGRYYWHWDPRFLKGEQRVGLEFERLEAAARQVKCPVLLVRGLLSDVVSDRSVQALREAIPHLEYVETKDAGHMVSGDRNDIFLSDLQGFLARHTRR